MHQNESEFERVRKLALKLPDVVEGTLHGAPSWKLGGKLLACAAIHKSAEPNSLLVKIAPAERGHLISAHPETYYLTDHYRDQPVVLVRLSQIDRKSLQAILQQAWRLVGEA